MRKAGGSRPSSFGAPQKPPAATRLSSVARQGNNIYLIGPMGSGKTAVGKKLAALLGKEFLDSDAEIERRTGVDIRYIFEKEGEKRFREREREVIAELTALDGVIVATGGGAVL